MTRGVLFSFIFMMIAAACGPSSPAIRVQEAWIRPDPLMENAAGYLIIRNDGNAPDALTGVEAEFVTMAQVHQTLIDGDVHRMEPISRIEIPPGGQIELRPLDYHLMLMGLKESLQFGESVRLTLSFERTGKIVVEAEVRRQ